MEAAPQLTWRMQTDSRTHPPLQPITSRTLTCNKLQSSVMQLCLHTTPRTMPTCQRAHVSTCPLMEVAPRPGLTCYQNRKTRYLSWLLHTSTNPEASSNQEASYSSLHSLASLHNLARRKRESSILSIIVQ